MSSIPTTCTKYSYKWTAVWPLYWISAAIFFIGVPVLLTQVSLSDKCIIIVRRNCCIIIYIVFVRQPIAWQPIAIVLSLGFKCLIWPLSFGFNNNYIFSSNCWGLIWSRYITLFITCIHKLLRNHFSLVEHLQFDNIITLHKYGGK